MDSYECSTSGKICFFLLLMAQNASEQFFSIYLKYLGLPAGDAGIVRALQTWAGLVAVYSSGFLSRVLFRNSCGLRLFIAMLVLTSVTSYVSLVFVPPFEFSRDVTHCSYAPSQWERRAKFDPRNQISTEEPVVKSNFRKVGEGLNEKLVQATLSHNAMTVFAGHQTSTIPALDTTKKESTHNYYKLNKGNGVSNNGDNIKFYDIEHSTEETTSMLKNEYSSYDATQIWRPNDGDDKNKIYNFPVTGDDMIENQGRRYGDEVSNIKDDYYGFGTQTPVAESDVERPYYDVAADTSMDRHRYQWSQNNRLEQTTRNYFIPTTNGRSIAWKNSKTTFDPQWEILQKVFFQPQKNVFNNIDKDDRIYGSRNYKKYRNPQYFGDQEEYYSQNRNNMHGIRQGEQMADVSADNLRMQQVYNRHFPSVEDPENLAKPSETKYSNKKFFRKRMKRQVENIKIVHREQEKSNSEVALNKKVTNIKLTGLSALDGNHLPRMKVTYDSSFSSTSENSNNSITNVHSYRLKYTSTVWGLGSRKYDSWANVFYTVIALSLLLKISCESVVMWIFRACEITVRDATVLIREFSTNYRVLIGWAILVCPAVGIMALLSPCPYQITAHMGAAATMTFIVLLLLPLVSPVSRSRRRKPSKPSYRKSYEDISYTLSQRLSSTLRMSITGFLAACNLEFMMWHMEEQENFKYNYEYLYCGYSGMVSLTSYLLIWLLQKRSKGELDYESESEDDAGGGGWQLHTRQMAVSSQWWWLWEVGTLLLGAEQLAAQLSPVWLLPPLLGVLQGAGQVLSLRGLAQTTAISYNVGYGCGCIVAGLIIQLRGMRVLFQSVSLGAALCATVGTVIRGTLQCSSNGKHSYSLPYPSVATDSENSSDVEEKEIAETDDWLVQAMQRDEYRQAKTSQRLEC